MSYFDLGELDFWEVDHDSSGRLEANAVVGGPSVGSAPLTVVALPVDGTGPVTLEVIARMPGRTVRYVYPCALTLAVPDRSEDHVIFALVGKFMFTGTQGAVHTAGPVHCSKSGKCVQRCSACGIVVAAASASDTSTGFWSQGMLLQREVGSGDFIPAKFGPACVTEDSPKSEMTPGDDEVGYLDIRFWEKLTRLRNALSKFFGIGRYPS